ncbi:MAG: peptidylprolyl isomerase [Gammaproteobacteria bacterium]
MLQIVRDKGRNVIAISVLGLAGVMFFAWGMNDFFSNRLSSNALIQVGSKSISHAEFSKIYENILAQEPRAKEANPQQQEQHKRMLLESLAIELQLSAGLEHLGFQISPEWINQLIKTEIQAIQENGKFSSEKYKAYLQKVGQTEREFQSNVAKNVLQYYFQQGISQSAFITEPELKLNASIYNEARKIGYVLMPKSKVAESIQVSEAEVQAYYLEHQADFVLPEKIKLAYVELNRDAIAKELSVQEADLKTVYEQNKSFYTHPAQIKAQHILIGKKPELKAEDAKKQAEKLLADLKAGADFSQLANQYSDDTGSKAQGGDLGWFSRESMVPEFGEAAFALNQAGDLSPIVETQFGYHIIRLNEKKPAKQQTFAEAKEGIEQKYRSEQAATIFNEKIEKFKNLSYENAESLNAVSQGLGLKIAETEFFSKEPEEPKALQGQNIAAQQQQAGNGILANPEIRTKAFEKTAYQDQQNSSPVAISPTHYVVFRVKEKQASVQQSLAEVSNPIMATLKENKTQEAVKNRGQALFAKLQALKPEELNAYLQQEGLTWKEAKIKRFEQNSSLGLSSELINNIFELRPKKDQAAWTASQLPSGDYAVTALYQVEPGTLEQLKAEAEKMNPGINFMKSYSQSLAEPAARQEMMGLVAWIRAKFPVQIKQ